MAIAPLIKLTKQIPKIEHEDGSALLKLAYHADEKTIVQLAWFLEQGYWMERDLELVFELYRWLKLNVNPCYQAECIRIQHMLTPKLPYKPSVVRKLFKWYKEGNTVAAGALMMALLSNKSMLQDYNAIL